jgi:DNA-binding LacI/PurR family transcriptional regulator
MVNMPVSIREVAQKAGVSVSTVSKVLNHSPLISEATTNKVRDVMEHLHYRPNLRAQNFARQRTHNVTFIARAEKNAAFNSPHLFEIMCGVENTLSEKGYSLTFINLAKGQDERTVTESLIEQKNTDGIVLHISAVSKKVSDVMSANNFPHIVIGKPDFESELCWIDTNNNLSGSIAVKHLFQAGYRHIAYIGGGKDDRISLHRLQGAQKTAEDLGISILPKDIRQGAVTIESARAITEQLILENRPEAIICANNTVAMGTFHSIRDHGLTIPDNIAVISFDDYPYSRIMEPALTVVNIDVYDMGAQAGTMLLRKIKQPSLQVQSYTTLPVLIVRDSTVKKAASEPKPTKI